MVLNNYKHFFTELSKEITYALRHAPWEFELELDAEGWVPVEQLIDSLQHSKQWNGGNRSYVLHHNTPIQRGGGVYDMNNITVMTPRFHLDVLDRGYHFGR